MEEAVAFCGLGAIIETGMQIKLGREVSVQHEVERILPLYAGPMVIGEVVETGLQCDGSDDVPIEGGL